MVIYTAIYGKYDKLIEQPDIGVKYVCYTDDPNLVSDCWEIRYEPLPCNPILAAKYWKVICPFEKSIWIDGNMEITHNKFVSVLTRDVDTIGFYRHPQRQSIKQEITELQRSGRAEDSNRQYAQYLSEGFKDKKLLNGGIIVRFGRHLNFGVIWLNEIMHWTYRDQVSLPYALWKSQTPVSIIKQNMYSNKIHIVHQTH